MLLGLIADTHGFLGEDAARALAGCDCILHAGDVGERVLEPLRALAPVVAVRGNTDLAGEPAKLPPVAFLDRGGRRIAVVHRLADAPSGGWDVLVFGHCHRRHFDREGSRLLVNPGAAGRRGFHAQRSVALLDLAPAGDPVCTFVDLGARIAAR
jgi:putative phosphoesterase